ncbi:MAG: hypothetical protein AAF223_21280 [Bacteroidota bacterium]
MLDRTALLGDQSYYLVGWATKLGFEGIDQGAQQMFLPLGETGQADANQGNAERLARTLG